MKEECCPPFNPKKWDKKTLIWKNKKFVKGKVFTIFYMPINFGSVISKLMKKIESSGAKSPNWLSLSNHTSKWNMDLYVEVNKKIKGLENISLTGKFLSKVYEGPFKNMGKWVEDFKNYTKNKKVKVKKEYWWYTTCPKCAKKYGKNYIVAVAEIKK